MKLLCSPTVKVSARKLSTSKSMFTPYETEMETGQKRSQITMMQPKRKKNHWFLTVRKN